MNPFASRHSRIPLSYVSSVALEKFVKINAADPDVDRYVGVAPAKEFKTVFLRMFL